MSAGTQMAMEVKQQDCTKNIKSTEVVTLGGYSQVVITFEDGSRLFTYGSAEQTKLV